MICLIEYTILTTIIGEINMKRKKPKRKLRIASTRKNLIPYSKYRIEWFDIASDSGWATDSEFNKMKLATPVSEGWLFSKDEDTVRIFAGYDVEQDGSIHFSERSVFPTSCVKKITRIH